MRLVAASTLTPHELADVRQIYFDGFAPHLRAPFDAPGIRRGAVLGDTGWVYLRYFTVGEKGRGLGEHLWTHLRVAMTGAGHTRIVHDVEDPAQPGIDPAEERIRHRRIAFYRRLGAVLLPVRGYLPPEGSAGHPMMLMAADHVAQTPAAAEDLGRIVVAVYEHRYGIAPSDPMVRRTLRLSGVSG